MPDPFGLLGQVIDAQLRVDAFVADGESSVVYRAQHLGGATVALKCLKTKPDAELMQRLRRRFWEACNTIDTLAHEEPGVCRVLASGVTTSRTKSQIVYMALEWLEGQSLAADFRTRAAAGMKGRTWGEVNAMFESAANAIACAHKKGIVHRDVKPTNLFLQQNGPMRVLDFGVAKILDDEGATGDTKSITRAPYYAAPEVFEPRFGPVGPWTDVYSFSLILLEALRDERVRAGRTYADIAHEILEHKRIPTPRTLGMSVNDPIETLFASAFALDPRKRPQNMGELWTRIRRALGLGSVRPPQRDFATTRQAGEASGFTQHMPSPSQMPSEVRRYLEPHRQPMPTPTQAFDDERTVAVNPPTDPPETLEQLPPSATPAMGNAAYVSKMMEPSALVAQPIVEVSAPAPQPMMEPSALVLTDSAILGIESASERLDRTVALKDAPPKPTFAQTMPLAQPEPAPPPPQPPRQPQPPPAPPPQPFVQTMPIATRPTEPAPMPPMPGAQPMAVPVRVHSPHAGIPAVQPKSGNRALLWVLIILLVLSLFAAMGVALLLLERRGH